MGLRLGFWDFEPSERYPGIQQTYEFGLQEGYSHCWLAIGSDLLILCISYQALAKHKNLFNTRPSLLNTDNVLCPSESTTFHPMISHGGKQGNKHGLNMAGQYSYAGIFLRGGGDF